MCGIAGVLTYAGGDFRVDRPYLARMRDTMVHRGPDSGRSWVSEDGRVGLAFRRLSIIDLTDSADQPMTVPSEALRIVFNGEIYNHAEIRKELQALGVSDWRTDHSDTEVLLRAYEQWGIDCLHRLRGMFAFALWDDRSDELWLVRDRIGIKPLYYSVHHGRITFASEIKALLQDADQPRAVNEEALFHYLSFLTTPAPQTLFDGIRKLPGGTWLRVTRNGDIREQRYWDVWDHTDPLVGASEEEVTERIIDELRTSVRYRKVADVPVGVFLSGGIDSSTNAALFSEGETEQVSTFSVGYTGDFDSYKNELGFARQMAEYVGAEHHEIMLSLDDLLGFIPRMVELQDEPIADPVCFPVFFVSQLAREHGRVVAQVGEGADELFAGYPFWHKAIRAQRYGNHLGKWSGRLAMRALAMRGGEENLPYEWLRRASLRQPLFWSGAEAFTDASKRKVLSQRLRQQFKTLTSWDVMAPIHRDFKEKAWDTSALNWMTYSDLRLRLPELLLMRVDKMSMGVSLECRVPFLDHRFVELAMSIPTDMKVDPLNPKRLLKAAVRGLIPDEIIDRPKQGFGVPIHEYFFDSLGDFARQELRSFQSETDLLDPKGVDALFEKAWSPHIWYLLNLALWWKTYLR